MPNIRNKGFAGEREVCKKLVEYGLVSEASRNLTQVRDSGSDVEVLHHISIEVKRHETLAIKSWWDQVCVSASRVGKIPCVFWRPNNKKWLIMLPAGTVPGPQVNTGVEGVGRVPSYAKYPHLQFVSLPIFVNWYKNNYVRPVS